VIAAVVALLAAAVGAGAPSAGALAECDAAVARAPDRYESYLCFYQAAARGSAFDAAAARLDRLAEQGRGEGWALLVRAHVSDVRHEGLGPTGELYRRSAERLAAEGRALGEVLARTNLRRILVERGDPAGAEVQVARALEVAHASDDREARVRALILEASHLTDLGRDLGRARAALLEAEADAFPGGSPGLQESVLRRFANLCYQLGRYDEAIEKLDRLLALSEQRGNVHDEPSLRFNVANVRRAQREERPVPGALDEVQGLSLQALQSARRHGDREVAARAHAFLTDLFDLRDAERAEEHGRRCLEEARRLEQRLPEMECLCAWARHVASRAPAEAEDALARAARIAEREGNDVYAAYVWGARLRTSWETRPAVEAARESLRSLEAIERLRAAQTDPQARIELFTNWTKDYYWLAGRLLRQAPPDLPLAFVVGERLRARVLLEALQKAGLPADPARPMGLSPVAGLEHVQAALGDDEVMLAFLVGLDRDLAGGFGGGSWLLAISRGSVRAREIPDRLRLEATVPVFVGLIERRDGSETRVAAALHRSLLGDLLGPEVRRLVVVPDGVLNELPFAALRASPDAPPLGALYEIALAPSATLWSRWRRVADRRLPAAALVLADPTGTGEGSLRHARREGASVRRAVGGDSRLLCGAQASEAALKSASLGSFGIVHFATHAVADDASPDRSAVLLAKTTGDDDGRLRPSEVAALDLRARAIVLSACRTAGGPVASGEGVLSLARAFFEGGARTVVASHERLRDDEAERLFEWFYAHLRQGETMGGALRSARRRAISEGVPAATWAGVVLLGDGDVVLEPRPPASWRLPLLLAGVAAAALGLWARDRRRVDVP
jgi:tetratricopeptide (TPR) repeat protein